MLSLELKSDVANQDPWMHDVPQDVIWRHARLKGVGREEPRVKLQDVFKARLQDELLGRTLRWREAADTDERFAQWRFYGSDPSQGKFLLCKISGSFAQKQLPCGRAWYDLEHLSVTYPLLPIRYEPQMFEILPLNTLQVSILKGSFDDGVSDEEQDFATVEALVEFAVLSVARASHLQIFGESSDPQVDLPHIANVNSCKSPAADGVDSIARLTLASVNFKNLLPSGLARSAASSQPNMPSESIPTSPRPGIPGFEKSLHGGTFSDEIVAGPIDDLFFHHFDGPTLYEDSLALWHAVKEGDVSLVHKKLAGLKAQGELCGVSIVQRALEHRRKIEGVLPRSLVGPVILYAAVLANEAAKIALHREFPAQDRLNIVQTLLDSKASANIRYSMLVGARNAYAYMPLIFCCGAGTDLLHMLLEKVDVNAVSFMNYHMHATCLWSACWRNQPYLVQSLIDRRAEINRPRTWSVDTPPRCQGQLRSQAQTSFVMKARKSLNGLQSFDRQEIELRSFEKHTVLELAALRGMCDSVKVLLEGSKGKIDLSTAGKFLQEVVAKNKAEVVGQIATLVAQECPGVLLMQDLTRTTDGNNKTHRETLRMIYSMVVTDREAAKVLRREVQNIVCPGEVEPTVSSGITPPMIEPRPFGLSSNNGGPANTRTLMDQIVRLLRTAPLAAGILLDQVYLQEPWVALANRNPLPFQCRIQGAEVLNTVYEESYNWWFDHENNRPPRWQLQLVGDGSGEHRFCNIKILWLPGSICIEIFMALEVLPKKLKGRTLTSSLSLQAIVSHTWWTWGRPRLIISVSNTVLQVISLLVWAICLRMPAEELNTYVRFFDIDYFVPMACWAAYSAVVILEVLEDATYAVGMISLDVGLTKREAFGEIADLRCFMDWASNSMALALIFSAWGDWKCESRFGCQIPLSIMQAIAWISLLFSLRAFRGLGYILIPIMDAITAPAMRGILGVMCFSLAGMTLFSVVEWQEFEMQVLLAKAGQTFIVAENDMFETDPYDDQPHRYVLVFICFFGFGVVIMNIFIAITCDSYNAQTKLVQGSFLAERTGICTEALLYRHMTYSCMDIFGLTPRRLLIVFVLTWSVVIFVIFVAHTAATEDFTAIVLLCVGLAVLSGTKILVNLRHSPPHRKTEAGSHWWVLPNFLWVCEAKGEDELDSGEKDVSKRHSELLSKVEDVLESKWQRFEEELKNFDQRQQTLEERFDERWRSLENRLVHVLAGCSPCETGQPSKEERTFDAQGKNPNAGSSDVKGSTHQAAATIATDRPIRLEDDRAGLDVAVSDVSVLGRPLSNDAALTGLADTSTIHVEELPPLLE